MTHGYRIDVRSFSLSLSLDSTSFVLQKRKLLLNLPTKICGRISVIETFSLSIASGVDGGGSLSSFLSRIEFVGHSINSGYSVLTASNPPKQMQKKTVVVYF